MPMFNEHPIEMGLKGTKRPPLRAWRRKRLNVRLFREAFPGRASGDPRQRDQGDRRVRADAAVGQLAARSVSVSRRADALDPAAVRGMPLFFSDRLACAGCHAGFNLSGPTVHDGAAAPRPTFHNTGLYDVDGRGAYRQRIAGSSTRRACRPTWGASARRACGTSPSPLRTCTTAAIPTLEGAVAHYASGGRQSRFRAAAERVHAVGHETADLVASSTPSRIGSS